ncbi:MULTISPECIES: holo-ACP synthase [Paenibacillus]|uniref:Holo-[acyl-carrier-protein] synthase n=2 Tax=Paenibacillus TaxID=44249 RepID=A0A1V4HNV0_9BACL|nr:MULTISPECIES: holo-ACP synthase [Paenibacillus]MEC0226033.1 holo-ACP synthase [Paenibacillus alba]OPH59304.1 holo-[acyl-carrier-protein] synthase [Paenibacillus ferrarius]
MIIGVGTDLVEIARLRKMLEGSSGERFLERILTPQERELAQQRRGRLAEFASGRFAAKEAIVKAIGCGIGKQIGFQDIEVLPDALGKPICSVREEALLRAGLKGSHRLHISITHTETMAAAYAIVEEL